MPSIVSPVPESGPEAEAGFTHLPSSGAAVKDIPEVGEVPDTVTTLSLSAAQLLLHRQIVGFYRPVNHKGHTRATVVYGRFR